MPINEHIGILHADLDMAILVTADVSLTVNPLGVSKLTGLTGKQS